MPLLIAAAAAGILLAVVLMVVLYRAISNVIDWMVLTFGNDSAVARLKAERDDEDEHPL
jgi:mannose/fructose/N-acetylgalactosamine-specific phosphotransferase system component IID